MLKIAAAGATALCAGILCTTPYSLSVTPQGSVSLSMDRAAARIGHPLTPMSVAGVHRRAMRRHVAFHRPFIRRPVVAGAGEVGAGIVLSSRAQVGAAAGEVGAGIVLSSPTAAQLV
jgi:hypothetical protein